MLRHGQVVVSGADVRAADLREVATIMIGDVSLLDVVRPDIERGPKRLAVSNLSVPSTHEIGCADIDFDVVGGQILGIVGVAGNGQTALAKALIGQINRAEGP